MFTYAKPEQKKAPRKYCAKAPLKPVQMQPLTHCRIYPVYHSNSMINQKPDSPTCKNTDIIQCAIIPNNPRPGVYQATVSYKDLNNGQDAFALASTVPGHASALPTPNGYVDGSSHPYHNERAHIIGRQLGGSGAVGNLIGLTNGTNSIMRDIETYTYNYIQNQGMNSSVSIDVRVSFGNQQNFCGPQTAWIAGMTDSFSYTVTDNRTNALVVQNSYFNGIFKRMRCGCGQ